MNIYISNRDVQRCREFSIAMGSMNQSHEFNNSGTSPRETEEISKDNFIGKLGECAVFKLMSSFGMDISPVDFEVIGANKKDSGDLVVNGKKVSVKSTEKGKYLLVHEGQLAWEDADLYILCQSSMTSNVKLMGFATREDVLDSGQLEKWRNQQCAFKHIKGDLSEVVLVGDSLPDKSFRMQSSNLYIHSENLRNNWFDIREFL